MTDFKRPNVVPVIMGVLNVTPDSFSDGGQFFDPDRAVQRGLAMAAEGAGIIDVGPESTRPGADEVSADEQCRRAVPVIRALREVLPDVTLSIDTRSAVVADRAIEAGASIINDVSALRDDPEMVDVARSQDVTVVIMHRRGTSQTMQQGGGPTYEDVVDDVRSFLDKRKQELVAEGVKQDRIWLDPGIGFGKRVEHNVALLGRLEKIVSLGSPVLVGASRKRFIGSILGEAMPETCDEPEARLPGSLACAIWAARSGASVIRVHDVRETLAAMNVWQHLEGSAGGEVGGTDVGRTRGLV
ncbi:MAG: dihydropteroate synthase [Phycisphaerae bacterium]